MWASVSIGSLDVNWRSAQLAGPPIGVGEDRRDAIADDEVARGAMQGRSGVRQANERETGRIDMRDAHRLVSEHDEIGARLHGRRQHVLPLRRGPTECDILDCADEPRRRRARQSQAVDLAAHPAHLAGRTRTAIDVVEQAHVARFEGTVPLGAHARLASSG